VIVIGLNVPQHLLRPRDLLVVLFLQFPQVLLDARFRCYFSLEGGQALSVGRQCLLGLILSARRLRETFLKFTELRQEISNGLFPVEP
jgi:hypothetical protein